MPMPKDLFCGLFPKEVLSQRTTPMTRLADFAVLEVGS